MPRKCQGHPGRVSSDGAGGGGQRGNGFQQRTLGAQATALRDLVGQFRVGTHDASHGNLTGSLSQSA